MYLVQLHLRRRASWLTPTRGAGVTGLQPVCPRRSPIPPVPSLRHHQPQPPSHSPPSGQARPPGHNPPPLEALLTPGLLHHHHAPVPPPPGTARVRWYGHGKRWWRLDLCTITWWGKPTAPSPHGRAPWRFPFLVTTPSRRRQVTWGGASQVALAFLCWEEAQEVMCHSSPTPSKS
jgi:hypothetical protein